LRQPTCLIKYTYISLFSKVKYATNKNTAEYISDKISAKLSDVPTIEEPLTMKPEKLVTVKSIYLPQSKKIASSESRLPPTSNKNSEKPVAIARERDKVASISANIT